MNRRHALVTLGSLVGLFFGSRHALHRVARAEPAEEALSPDALALVDRAWEGIDPARVLDVHAHLVGTGAGGTGCWVNPKMQSPLRHPVAALKFAIYRRASGVHDDARADQEYVERLAALLRARPRRGRMVLLPFDQVYTPDGAARPDLSEMYTPNAYARAVARAHPDLFVAGASVHPYRPDAAEELERCIAEGAVLVKWLPNAHRIDPSSPRCDAVYRVLARTGVPLLTHGGEEQAVDGEDAQALGNPLLLRRALDHGVKVIVAHGAGLGTDLDLDAPEGRRPRVPSQRLLFRMTRNPAWRDRLFIDLSAVCQANRCDRPLKDLLRSTELYPRYVNGSDYPLPAINALVRTGKLEALGYLQPFERRALNELDRHDPLLFDFVLKRTLRFRTTQGTYRFPESAFMPPPSLFAPASS